VKHAPQAIERPAALLVLLVIAATVTGITNTARAQTADPATTSESESTAAFPRGTEYYRLQGSYQNERSGADEHLATIGVAAGHYFLDNAAFEFQFLGYNGHDEEDGFGVGINALARYHFINVGRFSLYGDVLGGIFWTSADFPTGGTELNFTYAGGPGLSYRIREGLYLDGGIRFQHVSNFYIQGRDRNPVFNSFGGYVGLMWTR